jgi:hypothetical protein
MGCVVFQFVIISYFNLFLRACGGFLGLEGWPLLPQVGVWMWMVQVGLMGRLGYGFGLVVVVAVVVVPRRKMRVVQG